MKNKFLRRVIAVLTTGLTLSAMPLSVFADETTQGQWKQNNTDYYYVLSDGSYATGEQQIDSIWYLFAPNGVLQTGWQTVNGLRYYYSPKNNTPTFGWIQWRDGMYYVTEESGKATGFIETDLGTCYFDSYGVLQYGWFTDAEGSRYYAAENGVLTNGEALIDGIPYLFSDAGIQQLGWQTVDNRLYYYDPDDGESHFGWLTIEGTNYYLTPAEGAYIGEWQINGSRYAFDETGAQILSWYTFCDGSIAWFDPSTGEAVTGLQSIDGALYYFADDGAMQTGFQTIADAVYYFSDEGKMQSGFCTINDTRYYFDETGVMQTGWVVSGADTYYADGEGKLLTQWQIIDSNSYYFSSQGLMLTGFQTIDTALYYFYDTGVLHTGWLTTDSGTYYAGADGALLTGRQTIDGNTYYFSSLGLMQTGWQTIDGAIYYFSDTGVMQTGIVSINGADYAFYTNGTRAVAGWFFADDATYYCGADGSVCVNWQCIDGAYYYFNEDGTMAVSTTVDGYLIDADGIAATALKSQVLSMLPAAGDTPDSIYAYLTANYRYRRIEDTRTFEQLEQAGWDTLVEYTLANGRGVCYYLASTMDYFLQAAGYETRIVYANHLTGNHYWCQVWVNGEWRNYDPTFTSRGNMSWEEIVAAGNYTVYGFLTVQYNERGDYLGITYEEY